MRDLSPRRLYPRRGWCVFPLARYCNYTLENSSNFKYKVFFVLILQQANKQRSSNFQFRNTDESTCNNDKSLSFSPSKIAFPTGSTNNSLLPYGWEQKGMPIQNCVSTKVSSNKTNARYDYWTQLPANTVSSSYLTNKNQDKSTEHKTKKHFRLLPCFSAETTTKPHRNKNKLLQG